MEYGLKGLMAAVIKAQPENELPTYETPFSLGPAMELTDNPTFATAEGHGDNEVQASVSKFVSCPIALGSTEFGHEAASKLFGITLGQDNDLVFNAGDEPPYIGLVGYHDYNSTTTGDKFRGVYFPVCKMHPVGKNYTTTGDSFTLNGEKAEGTAIAAKNGDWRVYSDLFDTEEDALAWGKKKLGASV